MSGFIRGTGSNRTYKRDKDGRFGSGGGDALTGPEALAAPPLDLAEMARRGDPRAESIWFRTGDNSLETDSGVPGYVELNGYLRGSRMGSARMEARVADIDSAMRDSVLGEPIQVWRGGGTRFDDPGQAGRTFTDEAYVSTTTDMEHASYFDGPLMRIKVPAGTKAIRGADRSDSDFSESEIILDRGLKFKIVGDSTESGSRVLDVEVVS